MVYGFLAFLAFRAAIQVYIIHKVTSCYRYAIKIENLVFVY